MPIYLYETTSSWTYDGGDNSGYLLQSSLDSGSTWTDILSCSADVTSFHDINIPPATDIQYRVAAINNFGLLGPMSNITSVYIMTSQFFVDVYSNISNVLYWFNNSEEFSTGSYRIYYISGSMKYGTDNPLYKYQINSNVEGNAFYISYDNNLSSSLGPGSNTQYETAELCMAENSGSYIDITTTIPGAIGMYFHDFPDNDNVGGPIRFQLVNLS